MRLRNSAAIALAVLSLNLSLLSTAAFAWGAEHYQKGMDCYNKGDMFAAKTQFYAYIKANKGYYAAHYMLGNACSQLGEFANARAQYQFALKLNPPKNVKKAIDQALVTLANRQDQIPQQIETGMSANELALKNMEERANAFQQEKTKQAEAEKQRILADSDQKAEAILSDAKKRIAELGAASNLRLRDVGTGEWAGTGLPTRVSNDIMGQAEAEAASLRAQAQKKISGMSLSSTPTLHDTVNSLASQTLAPNNGTKLEAAGSNLHVRNYSHGQAKQVADIGVTK